MAIRDATVPSAGSALIRWLLSLALLGLWASTFDALVPAATLGGLGGLAPELFFAIPLLFGVIAVLALLWTWQELMTALEATLEEDRLQAGIRRSLR